MTDHGNPTLRHHRAAASKESRETLLNGALIEVSARPDDRTPERAKAATSAIKMRGRRRRPLSAEHV